MSITSSFGMPLASHKQATSLKPDSGYFQSSTVWLQPVFLALGCSERAGKAVVAHTLWMMLFGCWLVCVQVAEAHKRELRLLQQEQQVSIARAKEEVREAKNREISEVWAKSDQVYWWDKSHGKEKHVKCGCEGQTRATCVAIVSTSMATCVDDGWVEGENQQAGRRVPPSSPQGETPDAKGPSGMWIITMTVCFNACITLGVRRRIWVSLG